MSSFLIIFGIIFLILVFRQSLTALILFEEEVVSSIISNEDGIYVEFVIGVDGLLPSTRLLSFDI